jgi:hypothetical protein
VITLDSDDAHLVTGKCVRGELWSLSLDYHNIYQKKRLDLRYILILKCQNSETLKLGHLYPFFEIIKYFDKNCLTDVIFTYYIVQPCDVQVLIDAKYEIYKDPNNFDQAHYKKKF